MAAKSNDFEKQLCSLLEVSPKDEIVRYALTFLNKRDVLDYLKDILGDSFNQKQSVVNKCLSAWKPPSSTDVVRERTSNGSSFFQEKDSKRGKAREVKRREDGNSSTVKDTRSMAVTNFAFSNPKKEPFDVGDKQVSANERDQIKKKSPKKYVPLYTSEGKSLADEIMLLPGRHRCQCAAQKHKLVSNCLQCGRIVCEQEGSGPCLFCGNLVCSGEEQEILSRNSRASEKLYKKLMEKSKEVDVNHAKGLDQAKALKDKLIGFDRTSAKRTKVIDDQADYFSAESKWLSKQQREVARNKEDKMMDNKHQTRKSRKYVLDFAGREVREDVSNDALLESDYMDEFDESETQKENSLSQKLIDPSIRIAPPVFVKTAEFDKDFPRVTKSIGNSGNSSFRLQDEEMQKISDKGVCLSMHQPWATLLVKGIKQVEGRSWYSAHRGRLWIASTVKVPEIDQIQSIEKFYRFLHKDNIEFPDSYPSGALLGCVDVVSCLAQDEYQLLEKRHDESESDYVFICENPQELFLKLPIKGKHKIWKLDQQIHKAAKSGLMH